MRKDTRRNIIAYDIPHDRRRTKVAKILGTYGDRVQYSVFVVDCSPAALIRLKMEVEEIIDSAADSILFCDLGLVAQLAPTRYSYLGRAREVTGHGPLIM
ncbi:CRISPR-associated endonuclease Cas2 [Corynebacterium auriscanis]|uniref:CRISPR-associated endonuclease Cas2 n=1 Tax=Corynebacterium auriscanis TaxID=99807 RepID=UPI003CEACF5A